MFLLHFATLSVTWCDVWSTSMICCVCSNGKLFQFRSIEFIYFYCILCKDLCGWLAVYYEYHGILLLPLNEIISIILLLLYCIIVKLICVSIVQFKCVCKLQLFKCNVLIRIVRVFRMYKLVKTKVYIGSKCILQIISNVVVKEGMGNKGKLHRTIYKLLWFLKKHVLWQSNVEEWRINPVALLIIK